jgi:hypothetical protein
MQQKADDQMKHLRQLAHKLSNSCLFQNGLAQALFPCFAPARRVDACSPDFAKIDHCLNRCIAEFEVCREIDALVLVSVMEKVQNVKKDGASILPVAGADDFIARVGIALPFSRARAPAFKPRKQFVRVNAATSKCFATGPFGLPNFVNIDA